jgi:signal transduction histidine kinase
MQVPPAGGNPYRRSVNVLHSSRRTPLGVVALIVAMGVVGLKGLTSNAWIDDAALQGVDLTAALLVTGAASLAWAGRRAPATAALGNVALTVGWYQLGYTSWLMSIPYLVSFYLLGATGDRRRQCFVAGVAVGVSAVGMLAVGDESVSSTVGAVGWTIAAVLLGEITHNRRALLAEYEDRALRAEAERDAEAERRVAIARLEIARDLHDILAHTVSLMTVQAGVGRDALERGTDGAAAALGTIRAAGRDAMEEIQALVAVLRNGTDPASTAPAPRLDRLGELVAAADAAGVSVSLTVDVSGRAVSDVVQLTTYRVVQESLTNVVRHAAAGSATVAVRAEGSELVAEVRDDGVSPLAVTAPGGFGLRGMRERVESLGGRLRAGPEPGGGWRVTARMPLERWAG